MLAATIGLSIKLRNFMMAFVLRLAGLCWGLYGLAQVQKNWACRFGSQWSLISGYMRF